MVPIDHFDTAVDRYPHALALIDDDAVLTFAEVQHASYRVAGLLSTLTAKDPTPIVVYSPNDYRVMIAMIGIMRMGGVIVPLHAGNDVETSVAFLEQIQPRAMFYHGTLSSHAKQLRSRLSSLSLCVSLDNNTNGDPTLADVLSVSQRSVQDWIDPSGNRDRPMYYWATSASTGQPKVVVEDCGTFDVMLRVSRQRRGRHIPVGVTMSLAPMSHGGGPSAFASLTLGGTVLVMRQFDAHDALYKIQRHRVTELWLSPTALTLLLDYPELGAFDLSSLRTVLLGAAAIPADVLRRAVQQLGPCIAHSYGQIEASFITYFDTESVAAAAHGEHPERLASSGRTMNVNRIGIVDEDGVLVPLGHEGEIVVRGACVKRYLDPELTRNARRGGWHRTGDLGRLDEDGFLYVTGRVKDVVNMAGFKIPCIQVEGVIGELEGIQECAVVPAVDPVRGEVIRAVVTIRPGYVIEPPAIARHCRARIGARRTPHLVEIWTELPRSPAGKIDKRRIQSTPTATPAAGQTS